MTNRIKLVSGGKNGNDDGFARIAGQNFLVHSTELMTADLKDSGLIDNDVFAQALPSAPIGTPNAQVVIGAYRIPYFTRDGEILEGMYRDKLFFRPGITEDRLKKLNLAKYRGPSAELAAVNGADALMPYMLPGGRGRVGVICEGEKKTAAALSRFKCPVLGIGGCWNWGDGSSRRRLHGDIVWWAEQLNGIIVIADPDIATNQQIMQGYSGLAVRLRAVKLELKVSVITLPDKLDDWLLANPAYGMNDLENEEEIEDLPLSVRDLVERYNLDHKTNAQGVVTLHKNNHNVTALLKEHTSWKGELRWNLDIGAMEIYGNLFEEGLHDAIILDEMNHRLHMPELGMGVLWSAIPRVAKQNSYSPAVDDINAEEWDGVARVKDIFGRDRDSVVQSIAYAFVYGYISLTLHPGKDWRIMVLLVGPQGVGKTGMAKWLAGEKRVVEIPRGGLGRHDKDLMIRIMNAGVTIFDDVDTFSGVEKGMLKSLITQTQATARGAYKRDQGIFIRRGIMMGTSNHLDIIPDDPTGNTRFAVVEIEEKQDFVWLNANRLQILAEVRERRKKGEEPNIDWGAITEVYTEASEIGEKAEQFKEYVGSKESILRPIVGRSGAKYVKLLDFWNWAFPMRKPTGWDTREAAAWLKKVGFANRGKTVVDRDKTTGKNIKNVYKIPEE